MYLQPKPSKRKRDEIRMDAVTLLAPQYAKRQSDGVECMDWSSTDDGNKLSNNQHWEDPTIPLRRRRSDLGKFIS